MTTPVALARIIKEVVNSTPALIEADGMTGQVPEFIQIKFDASDMAIFQKMREVITPMYTYLQEAYNSLSSADIMDASKEFQRLVILRCLRLLGNTDTLASKSFAMRPITSHDLSRVTDRDVHAAHSDSSGLLQLRYELSPDGAPLFTWAVLTDGKLISRGEAQPIHKMIASLMRPLNLPACGDNRVQEAIATLAKMTSSGDKYYVYLTNTKIAKHYMMFQEFLTTTSCMSKAASFYSYTGQGQHPMDAYSDSPDWRLMLLSPKSPTELLEMAEQAMANPDMADSIISYPFVTRCLVLPKHLEESGRMDAFQAPYVFGKIYGNDKLVKYFFGDAHSSKVQLLNNNGLLIHSARIAGGRIKREETAHADHEGSGYLVLPYFDQANIAKFHDDDQGLWWKATYTDYENTRGDARAKVLYKALYQEGIAESSYIYSAHEEMYMGYTYKNPFNYMQETLLGFEPTDIVRAYYTEYVSGHTTLLVPKRMLVNGCMPYDLRKMITGELVPIATLESEPERYIKLDNDAGYCDLTNPAHCTLKQAMGY